VVQQVTVFSNSTAVGYNARVTESNHDVGNRRNNGGYSEMYLFRLEILF
jgi:hypothetical protein